MTTETAAPVSLLRIPALRYLFLARTISVLGDMLVPVALAFAVLDFGGGASGLGFILAARAVPSVVLLLLGGVVGDRYPRRTVLLLSSSVACATQLLIGLLLVTGSAATWSIAAFVAVRGATSAFFNPTSTAAIAYVAPAERRQATFALFTIAGNTAEVAGPSLAGVLLLALNPGWILVFDAATFLLGAMLIGRAGALGSPTGATTKRGLRSELRSGLGYVRASRWLSAVIASASAFQVFLLATLSVLGPVVALSRLGGSSSWAAISAALGAGGMLGSSLAMVSRPGRPLLVGYSLLVLGCGPTLLLLAVPATTPVLAFTEFISGIAVAYFGAMEASAIAKRVPSEMLARVDSVNRFGSMALRPIGMLCIGPIASAIGVRQALIAAGLLTLLSVSAPLLVQEVRNLESG
ncbi:MFS transporter [Jatrophihabitans sp. DSM 45814]